MGQSRFVTPVSWTTANGTAIASSTTETAIFPARSVPTEEINQEGRTYRIKAWGKYNTTSAPTIVFGLRWGSATGGVLLCKSDAIVAASGITNALWEVEILLTVRATGATGTILAMGTAIVGSGIAPTVGSATGAAAVGLMGVAGGAAPAAATVDLTAATALTLTATWGTNSASNTLTGMETTTELVN